MRDAATDPRRAELVSRLLVMVLAGLFLFGLLGFAAAVLDAGDARSSPPARPSLPPDAVALDDAVTLAEEQAPRIAEQAPRIAEQAPRILLALAEEPVATASAPPIDRSTAAQAGSSPPPASMAPAASDVRLFVTEQVMPVVPVVRFWSTLEGLPSRGIVRALETGKLQGVGRIVVADGIADALAAALGIELHPDVVRGDVEAVRRAIRRGGLGLLPATDLAPSMRSLRIDGRALVGNDRVKRLADWPLSVTQQLAEGEGWDAVPDVGAGGRRGLLHRSRRLRLRGAPGQGRGLPLRRWQRACHRPGLL